MSEAPGTDPIAVLADWYREAREVGALDADALTLGTSTRDGRPSVRVVLLKGISGNTLSFATNYASRKGREIDENPQVALGFFWPELRRQVRVEGVAGRAPAAESEAYFRSRPRESQLGAWASRQSEVIESRAALEAAYAAAEERFSGREVERPGWWGLYHVEARRVELWIGRPHRLHDRFLYTRSGDGWSVVRLAP